MRCGSEDSVWAVAPSDSPGQVGKNLCGGDSQNSLTENQFQLGDDADFLKTSSEGPRVIVEKCCEDVVVNLTALFGSPRYTSPVTLHDTSVNPEASSSSLDEGSLLETSADIDNGWIDPRKDEPIVKERMAKLIKPTFPYYVCNLTSSSGSLKARFKKQLQWTSVKIPHGGGGRKKYSAVVRSLEKHSGILLSPVVQLRRTTRRKLAQNERYLNDVDSLLANAALNGESAPSVCGGFSGVGCSSGGGLVVALASSAAMSSLDASCASSSPQSFLPACRPTEPQYRVAGVGSDGKPTEVACITSSSSRAWTLPPAGTPMLTCPAFPLQDTREDVSHPGRGRPTTVRGRMQTGRVPSMGVSQSVDAPVAQDADVGHSRESPRGTTSKRGMTRKGSAGVVADPHDQGHARHELPSKIARGILTLSTPQGICDQSLSKIKRRGSSRNSGQRDTSLVAGDGVQKNISISLSPSLADAKAPCVTPKRRGRPKKTVTSSPKPIAKKEHSLPTKSVSVIESSASGICQDALSTVSPSRRRWQPNVVADNRLDIELAAVGPSQTTHTRSASISPKRRGQRQRKNQDEALHPQGELPEVDNGGEASPPGCSPETGGMVPISGPVPTRRRRSKQSKAAESAVLQTDAVSDVPSLRDAPHPDSSPGTDSPCVPRRRRGRPPKVSIERMQSSAPSQTSTCVLSGDSCAGLDVTSGSNDEQMSSPCPRVPAKKAVPAGRSRSDSRRRSTVPGASLPASSSSPTDKVVKSVSGTDTSPQVCTAPSKRGRGRPKKKTVNAPESLGEMSGEAVITTPARLESHCVSAQSDDCFDNAQSATKSKVGRKKRMTKLELSVYTEMAKNRPTEFTDDENMPSGVLTFGSGEKRAPVPQRGRCRTRGGKSLPPQSRSAERRPIGFTETEIIVSGNSTSEEQTAVTGVTGKSTRGRCGTRGGGQSHRGRHASTSMIVFPASDMESELTDEGLGDDAGINSQCSAMKPQSESLGNVGEPPKGLASANPCLPRRRGRPKQVSRDAACKPEHSAPCKPEHSAPSKPEHSAPPHQSTSSSGLLVDTNPVPDMTRSGTKDERRSSTGPLVSLAKTCARAHHGRLDSSKGSGRSPADELPQSESGADLSTQVCAAAPPQGQGVPEETIIAPISPGGHPETPKRVHPEMVTGPMALKSEEVLPPFETTGCDVKPTLVAKRGRCRTKAEKSLPLQCRSAEGSPIVVPETTEIVLSGNSASEGSEEQTVVSQPSGVTGKGHKSHRRRHSSTSMIVFPASDMESELTDEGHGDDAGVNSQSTAMKPESLRESSPGVVTGCPGRGRDRKRTLSEGRTRSGSRVTDPGLAADATASEHATRRVVSEVISMTKPEVPSVSATFLLAKKTPVPLQDKHGLHGDMSQVIEESPTSPLNENVNITHPPRPTRHPNHDEEPGNRSEEHLTTGAEYVPKPTRMAFPHGHGWRADVKSSKTATVATARQVSQAEAILSEIEKEEDFEPDYLYTEEDSDSDALSEDSQYEHSQDEHGQSRDTSDEHDIIETSVEPGINETSDDHDIIKTSVERRINDTPVERGINETSDDHDSIETSDVPLIIDTDAPAPVDGEDSDPSFLIKKFLSCQAEPKTSRLTKDTNVSLKDTVDEAANLNRATLTSSSRDKPERRAGVTGEHDVELQPPSVADQKDSPFAAGLMMFCKAFASVAEDVQTSRPARADDTDAGKTSSATSDHTDAVIAAEFIRNSSGIDEGSGGIDEHSSGAGEGSDEPDERSIPGTDECFNGADGRSTPEPAQEDECFTGFDRRNTPEPAQEDVDSITSDTANGCGREATGSDTSRQTDECASADAECASALDCPDSEINNPQPSRVDYPTSEEPVADASDVLAPAQRWQKERTLTVHYPSWMSALLAGQASEESATAAEETPNAQDVEDENPQQAAVAEDVVAAEKMKNSPGKPDDWTPVECSHDWLFSEQNIVIEVVSDPQEDEWQWRDLEEGEACVGENELPCEEPGEGDAHSADGHASGRIGTEATRGGEAILQSSHRVVTVGDNPEHGEPATREIMVSIPLQSARSQGQALGNRDEIPQPHPRTRVLGHPQWAHRLKDVSCKVLGAIIKPVARSLPDEDRVTPGSSSSPLDLVNRWIRLDKARSASSPGPRSRRRYRQLSGVATLRLNKLSVASSVAVRAKKPKKKRVDPSKLAGGDVKRESSKTIVKPTKKSISSQSSSDSSTETRVPAVSKRAAERGDSRRGSSEEKSRRGSSDEKSRRGSSDEKSRRGSSDEKSRRGSSDEKSRRGSSDEKSRRGSSDEKSRRGSSDEKQRPKSKGVKKRRVGDVTVISSPPTSDPSSRSVDKTIDKKSAVGVKRKPGSEASGGESLPKRSRVPGSARQAAAGDVKKPKKTKTTSTIPIQANTVSTSVVVPKKRRTTQKSIATQTSRTIAIQTSPLYPEPSCSSAVTGKSVSVGTEPLEDDVESMVSTENDRADVAADVCSAASEFLQDSEDAAKKKLKSLPTSTRKTPLHAQGARRPALSNNQRIRLKRNNPIATPRSLGVQRVVKPVAGVKRQWRRLNSTEQQLEADPLQEHKRHEKTPPSKRYTATPVSTRSAPESTREGQLTYVARSPSASSDVAMKVTSSKDNVRQLGFMSKLPKAGEPLAVLSIKSLRTQRPEDNQSISCDSDRRSSGSSAPGTRVVPASATPSPESARKREIRRMVALQVAAIAADQSAVERGAVVSGGGVEGVGSCESTIGAERLLAVVKVDKADEMDAERVRDTTTAAIQEPPAVRRITTGRPQLVLAPPMADRHHFGADEVREAEEQEAQEEEQEQDRRTVVSMSDDATTSTRLEEIRGRAESNRTVLLNANPDVTGLQLPPTPRIVVITTPKAGLSVVHPGDPGNTPPGGGEMDIEGAPPEDVHSDEGEGEATKSTASTTHDLDYFDFNMEEFASFDDDEDEKESLDKLWGSGDAAPATPTPLTVTESPRSTGRARRRQTRWDSPDAPTDGGSLGGSPHAQVRDLLKLNPPVACGGNPGPTEGTWPWSRVMSTVAPLAKSDLQFDTTNVLPDTVNNIQMCVRKQDWSRLADLFQSLQSFGELTLQRHLHYFIDSLFTLCPVEELDAVLLEFLRAYKLRRPGTVLSEGDRRPLTTVGISLVVLFTDADNWLKAYRLLDIMVQEQVLSADLSFSSTCVIPACRLAVTAVRVCLTVQMYPLIWDLLQMTDWFRRPLGGVQGTDADSLSALSVVLGELLWEVKAKSSRGVIAEDTRKQLIEYMARVADHVAATYCRDGTHLRFRTIIDMSGLLSCLVSLAGLHDMTDVALTLFNRCLAMRPHQVALRPRIVRRFLIYLVRRMRDDDRMEMEALKVLTYGTRAGLYPEQVPFRFPKRHHYVRLYGTMNADEMFAMLCAYLEHMFENLVAHGLLNATPGAYVDYFHVKVQTICVDAKKNPQILEAYADRICEPKQQVWRALKRAGLHVAKYAFGNFDLTPESVVDAMQTLCEKRQREGVGAGAGAGAGAAAEARLGTEARAGAAAEARGFSASGSRIGSGRGRGNQSGSRSRSGSESGSVSGRGAGYKLSPLRGLGKNVPAAPPQPRLEPETEPMAGRPGQFVNRNADSDIAGSGCFRSSPGAKNAGQSGFKNRDSRRNVDPSGFNSGHHRRNVDQSRFNSGDHQSGLGQSGFTVGDAQTDIDQSGLNIGDSRRDVDPSGVNSGDTRRNVDQSGVNVGNSQRDFDQSGVNVGNLRRNVDQSGFNSGDNQIHVDQSGFNSVDHRRNVDLSGFNSGYHRRNVDQSGFNNRDPRRDFDQSGVKVGDSRRDVHPSGFNNRDPRRDFDQSGVKVGDSRRDVDHSGFKDVQRDLDLPGFERWRSPMNLNPRFGSSQAVKDVGQSGINVGQHLIEVNQSEFRHRQGMKDVSQSGFNSGMSDMDVSHSRQSGQQGMMNFGQGSFNKQAGYREARPWEGRSSEGALRSDTSWAGRPTEGGLRQGSDWEGTNSQDSAGAGSDRSLAEGGSSFNMADSGFSGAFRGRDVSRNERNFASTFSGDVPDTRIDVNNPAQDFVVAEDSVPSRIQGRQRYSADGNSLGQGLAEGKPPTDRLYEGERDQPDIASQEPSQGHFHPQPRERVQRLRDARESFEDLTLGPISGNRGRFDTEESNGYYCPSRATPPAVGSGGYVADVPGDEAVFEVPAGGGAGCHSGPGRGMRTGVAPGGWQADRGAGNNSNTNTNNDGRGILRDGPSGRGDFAAPPPLAPPPADPITQRPVWHQAYNALCARLTYHVVHENIYPGPVEPAAHYLACRFLSRPGRDHPGYQLQMTLLMIFVDNMVEQDGKFLHTCSCL